MSQLPNSAIADFGSTTGVLAFFEEGTSLIYLYEVRREGSLIVFEFRSTASGLADRALSFSRSLASDDYETEYSTSLSVGVEISLSESNCVNDEIWEGYLVTGSLRELLEVLHTDGMKLRGGSTDAVIEPAVVRNLSSSYVRSLNLANGDRTRATNPAECIQSISPFTVQPVYVQKECMTGRIIWKEGYNCVISQNNSANEITIRGETSGGAGDPCVEVPLFATEAAPTDSSLLTGGVACNEVIRSLNGVGGRVLDVLSGPGVTVVSDPDTNLIIIDVDTNDMAVCFDGETPEESFCPEESVNPLCGPL